MNRVECHVFSGLGGWLFDRGTRTLEKMIDDLPATADAHHWAHGKWEKVADDIIARHKKFGPAVVILIGHSYGALRCQQIATRLKSHKILVYYIAGIDPTALPLGHPPMVIPDNVRQVDEIWATSGFPASARRRDPSGLRGGRYVKGNWTPIVVADGHVASASNKITQSKILQVVGNLLA